MKWLAWLLILFNVILLGYFQLVPQRPSELQGGHEAIEPARLKILTPEELALQPEKPPEPAPVAGTVVTAPPPAPEPVCYEWGSFAPAEAERAKSVLDKLGLEAVSRKHTPQEALRYWIYIPPRKSLEEAQAKLNELNALGVQEHFIVQDPKWRYAISLGMFKDEGLAHRFLQDLNQRGVKSAVKMTRNQEASQVGYLIKNMTPAQLEEIGKLEPDFPGSEVRQNSCQ